MSEFEREQINEEIIHDSISHIRELFSQVKDSLAEKIEFIQEKLERFTGLMESPALMEERSLAFGFLEMLERSLESYKKALDHGDSSKILEEEDYIGRLIETQLTNFESLH